MQRRRVQRRKRADALQSLTLSAAAAAEDILGRVLAKGYANQDNLTAAVLEFREITHEPHAVNQRLRKTQAGSV